MNLILAVAFILGISIVNILIYPNLKLIERKFNHDNTIR